jgi:phenylacetic acid degradation operon negative regulatory protein
MAGFAEGLMRGLQMTAAGFIVTIYGDVVLPRGGVLWMGSLIALCGQVGINESLVRTAVSRLVAADQLKGERAGRRSYYRLSPNAQAEFAEVSDRLYGPLRSPAGWYVLYAPALSGPEGRYGHPVKLSGDVWVCPDLGDRPPPAEITLRADASDPGSLSRLAALWDLPDLNRRYTGIVERFEDLGQSLEAQPLAPADALVARLLLVHLYRGALLRDPCLPRAALPSDWNGERARALFVDIYRRLSPAAERAISAQLEGEAGPLPAQTADTERRKAPQA